MGAVQKLATVVIIGLVALATVLVVYLADEPNRRSSETGEQDAVAIERGTDLYITYCLQCHGPSGLGSMGAAYGEKPARVGGILNQAYLTPDQLAQANAVFQSDDPVKQSVAEDWLRFRIIYGIPAEPNKTTKVMPAFGNDLNVEEVNDLVYLIMHGNWNYVYNTTVKDTGKAVADAQCIEDPSGEFCGHTADAPPAYPTPPPPAGASSESAASPAATDQGAGSTGLTIEAQDVAFSTDALSAKPGDTITMNNVGALEHDFVVDELGIKEVAAGGETVTITIPEDAAPGEYTFYCSVPGHKEAGMVGTLTIEG